MNKFRIFLSYDIHTKLLFLEAFILLGWARILKSLPFSKVAPILGEQMNETSYEVHVQNKMIIRQVSEVVNIISKYTFWESLCLVKAIAAMKMLERRKIESTIYLGMGKDESGKLLAHAWLRSGPFYITGFEVMNKFTVVNKFAKRASSSESNRGENHG